MIPGEQIARLAELYDRYNNALDPLSEDCLEARRIFAELAPICTRLTPPM